MKLRFLAIFVCVCVFFAGSPLSVSSRGVCRATLFVGEKADGIYEVIFEVSEADFCGVFGMIEYDEGLILLSAWAECYGAGFSFFDVGGEVRFLLDGAENIDGALVRLYFAASEESVRGGIRIASLEAYRYFGGGVEEVEIVISNGEVGIGKEGEDYGCVLPELELFDAGEDDMSLVLSGYRGGDYFAVGAEIFIIGDDGCGEKMTVAGVVPLSGNGKIELDVYLGKSDWIAVVLTPIAYSRLGCVKGEKAVIFAASLENFDKKTETHMSLRFLFYSDYLRSAMYCASFAGVLKLGLMSMSVPISSSSWRMSSARSRESSPISTKV